VTTCFERLEALREGIAEMPFDVGVGDPVHITVSFGIASIDPLSPIEVCIDRTDKALYAAKSAGRNCTKIWDSSM
jgi:PleD family two-component response regulator